MSDIFLSYSRKNREIAKKFTEAFEMHGYSIWWDRNIPPGKKFNELSQKNWMRFRKIKD